MRPGGNKYDDRIKNGDGPLQGGQDVEREDGKSEQGG